jgi:hypothetical protein
MRRGRGRGRRSCKERGAAESGIEGERIELERVKWSGSETERNVKGHESHQK